LASLLVLGLAAWLFIYFKGQGQKRNIVQQEINIQEASVGINQYLNHKNFAGFMFEYPDNLILTETELDNDQVYAALELQAADGKKMILRIFDDNFVDSESWLDQFEINNAVVDLTNLLWVDIPAKRFESGAPTKLYTVAAENGVVYWLESPADSAFFIKAHEHLITSFRFDKSVNSPSSGIPSPQETDSETITLIEEVVI
jgi:hypothetical protein